MPFLPSNQQRQSTEGMEEYLNHKALISSAFNPAFQYLSAGP